MEADNSLAIDPQGDANFSRPVADANVLPHSEAEFSAVDSGDRANRLDSELKASAKLTANLEHTSSSSSTSLINRQTTSTSSAGPLVGLFVRFSRTTNQTVNIKDTAIKAKKGRWRISVAIGLSIIFVAALCGKMLFRDASPNLNDDQKSALAVIQQIKDIIPFYESFQGNTVKKMGLANAASLGDQLSNIDKDCKTLGVSFVLQREFYSAYAYTMAASIAVDNRELDTAKSLANRAVDQCLYGHKTWIWLEANIGRSDVKVTYDKLIAVKLPIQFLVLQAEALSVLTSVDPANSTAAHTLSDLIKDNRTYIVTYSTNPYLTEVLKKDTK